MTEDQAKEFLEVQSTILNKVTVVETICIVFAALSGLGLIGCVIAAFLL